MCVFTTCGKGIILLGHDWLAYEFMSSGDEEIYFLFRFQYDLSLFLLLPMGELWNVCMHGLSLQG